MNTGTGLPNRTDGVSGTSGTGVGAANPGLDLLEQTRKEHPQGKVVYQERHASTNTHQHHGLQASQDDTVALQQAIASGHGVAGKDPTSVTDPAVRQGLEAHQHIPHGHGAGTGTGTGAGVGTGSGAR